MALASLPVSVGTFRFISETATQDLPRILPTSMKSCTATPSSFSAIIFSCLICSGIAENDEVVAVPGFQDVGNILTWVDLLDIAVRAMLIIKGDFEPSRHHIASKCANNGMLELRGD